MNVKSNGPIVVHDLFGGHRAGLFFSKSYFVDIELDFFCLATFCALYTMTEEIEVEGTLNIYELAKLYHIKRPGIWRHNVSKRKAKCLF